MKDKIVKNKDNTYKDGLRQKRTSKDSENLS